MWEEKSTIVHSWIGWSALLLRDIEIHAEPRATIVWSIGLIVDISQRWFSYQGLTCRSGKFMQIMARSLVNHVLPRTQNICDSPKSRRKLSTKALLGEILPSHNDFPGSGCGCALED
ncbi:MAG: hypothetical protein CL912_19360 [Deltaproteobacteria bacterium]|nr:hypothetical protein [Deltaproteobacteria bacterium]